MMSGKGLKNNPSNRQHGREADGGGDRGSARLLIPHLVQTYNESRDYRYKHCFASRLGYPDSNPATESMY